MRTFILGTAGHVDHGKTSLVRALTGTDTDRLDEEHRRGISIELGFAHLDLGDDLRLGIIDVPGHERFVRQMVAGAGGMDLAILLVAADEGVMPQTREHFDVLRLLGVRAGMIVLTKIDIAEPDLVELVEEEVRDLVAGSFLEGARCLCVSSTTAQGIDELRDALRELASTTPLRERSGDFRLPADRVFALAGAGVVVTGTAWSGRVRKGDTLRLMPQDREVRVREVQSHGSSSEEAGAGERVALSLNGVKQDELDRGDQLVSGKAWQASSLIGVRVTGVDDPVLAARLKPRARVHVHHAAREVLGRIDWLEGEGELSAGETRLARLILEAPLVATAGDRVVLRTYSPMLTAAGAVVLDPQGAKGERRAKTLGRLRVLDRLGPTGWAFGADRTSTSGSAGNDLLARLAMIGFDAAAAKAEIATRVEAGQLLRLGERYFATAPLEALRDRALQILRAHQERAPMTLGLGREELRKELAFEGNARLFGSVLESWEKQVPLFVREDRVRADRPTPELDASAQAALDAVEARVRAAQPLFEASDEDLRDPALRLLVDSGRAVRLEGRLVAHRDHLDRLVDQARQHFATEDSLEIGPVKDWTGASRKFVVPLLEWLDRNEYTRNDKGVRRQGPKL